MRLPGNLQRPDQDLLSMTQPIHTLKLQLYYTHVIEIWSHFSGLGYVQILGGVLFFFFLLYLVEITIFY